MIIQLSTIFNILAIPKISTCTLSNLGKYYMYFSVDFLVTKK